VGKSAGLDISAGTALNRRRAMIVRRASCAIPKTSPFGIQYYRLSCLRFRVLAPITVTQHHPGSVSGPDKTSFVYFTPEDAEVAWNEISLTRWPWGMGLIGHTRPGVMRH
jgi:hypothetical protein